MAMVYPNSSIMCPFKTGDAVRHVESGVLGIVTSVPGEKIYDRAGYLNPNNGFEVKFKADRFSQWRPWSEFLHAFNVDEKPEAPKVEILFEEPEVDEFDDDCIIDCKPGMHACGKK